MRQIEVQVMNPEVVESAETMMCGCALLTQRAEKISCMDDLMKLFGPTKKDGTPRNIKGIVANNVSLPHPTIQKFAVINIAVVGASRRFLAQITRHQNEVKFMSGSLQYSDYSSDGNKTDFVVPYNYIDTPLEKVYLENCKKDFEAYKQLVEEGKNLGFDDAGDEAGYAMPQGLRNVLIISATPYQFKHMIGQRICNRNTLETRYVMLKIWEALYELSPEMFGTLTWGCVGSAGCQEGKFACFNTNPNMKPLGKHATPAEILAEHFPKLYKA